MGLPLARILSLGTLLLSGAVFGAPTTTSQATPVAGALNLGGTGSLSTHIQKVADLTISTENASGCSVTVTPGDLSKSDGETPISIQVLVVADGAATPGDADFTSSAGAPFVFSVSSSGTHLRDVYIRYSPRALQDPGTYNSSLTVTATDS